MHTRPLVSHRPCLPPAHVPAYLVLVELAHKWAGKEVAVVHSQSKGATVRGAQQGGHGLQKADCDAWHLRVPLADTSQLLAQGLLHCQGKGAWAGALPSWVRTQWEDLESRRYKNAEAPVAPMRILPQAHQILSPVHYLRDPGSLQDEWHGSLTPQELP